MDGGTQVPARRREALAVIRVGDLEPSGTSGSPLSTWNGQSTLPHDRVDDVHKHSEGPPFPSLRTTY